MCANEFIDVKINVGGKIQTIKMEKGTSFENNGGIYTVTYDGALTVFDKNQKKQVNIDTIKMTNYQKKVFDAVANNDNKEGLSQKDIELAMKMYSEGKFTKDMSEFLPDGYKIESTKKSTPEQYVQVKVANQKDSTSQAALKFKIINEPDSYIIEYAKEVITGKYNNDKFNIDDFMDYFSYEGYVVNFNEDMINTISKALDKYEGKPFSKELANDAVLVMADMFKDPLLKYQRARLGALAYTIKDSLTPETLKKLEQGGFFENARKGYNIY